jgi:hypothetical protein
MVPNFLWRDYENDFHSHRTNRFSLRRPVNASCILFDGRQRYEARQKPEACPPPSRFPAVVVHRQSD